MGCLYENTASSNGFTNGRSDEQCKAIYYFVPRGGCIGKLFMKPISDEQYDAMVEAKAATVRDKKYALKKLGIDEDMVKEVAPLCLEGYSFTGNVFCKQGKDLKWRSSKYQITWVFCGDNQLYFYSYTFNTDEDGKKTEAEEYFYKDVTNISHSSETEEVVSLRDSKGNPLIRNNVTYNQFMISAMGDKRYCAMEANETTERAIQGLKNKLREKKNA